MEKTEKRKFNKWYIVVIVAVVVIAILAALCVAIFGRKDLKNSAYKNVKSCESFKLIASTGPYPVDFKIMSFIVHCEERLTEWQFCGTKYDLEVKQGGSWKTIPKKDTATERLNFINEKQMMIRFDQADFDYKFTEGKYRFIQNVTKDANEEEQTDDVQIVFEFELRDEDENVTTVVHKTE